MTEQQSLPTTGMSPDNVSDHPVPFATNFDLAICNPTAHVLRFVGCLWCSPHFRFAFFVFRIEHMHREQASSC